MSHQTSLNMDLEYLDKKCKGLEYVLNNAQEFIQKYENNLEQ